MPPIVLLDARDATAPQLRGWGRYARELLVALPSAVAGELELELLERGGAGPEWLFEQLKLPLAARRSRASVIHALNCFLPVFRPCAGVVTVHDLAFEAWPGDFRLPTRVKYRVMARAAARSAQRVIVPSRFTRDDVCERWGVDPERVRVVPEAPALAGADGPTPAGRYVLAVGDLRRKKNLEVLVRAFRRLHESDPAVGLRLVLAGGDGGSGESLRALAARAPVDFPGYVDDARLDALIRGADVLVHPSVYEGFGLVVLEAMVRGTPVLAARAGALPETGGEAASYFDPHDDESLARELGELLNDEGRRAELAREGRDWAARFSWERTARETAAVYRELV